MPMFARTVTRPRRILALATAALMAASLGSAGSLGLLGGGAAQAGRPDPAGTAVRAAPGPIHAGNMFGWYGHGGLVYDETFVGPLNHKRWRVEGPGAVRT